MSRSQLMIKLKPKPGFLDFYDNVPSKVISIWTASNGISEMVDLFAVMSSVARLSHSIAEERSNIKQSKKLSSMALPLYIKGVDILNHQIDLKKKKGQAHSN